ncbi:HFL187Wp [Eremothecium sinecaudum]|uniref:non-specific serine/threonine protein kinase n=1 Tax=Eremothecium sinecaudum TaxID=45286 RepID=A0A0X8HUJ0_9SACH|nr:HFL187Wp [Eremothecium sinecaudum]AMD21669.1 HFL187Wp [Eremothecium sinecaudum]
MMISRRKTPNDFLFKEELGHGSYSTVYRVMDKSNQFQYAIKICSKRHIINENKVKYVTMEKDILNSLGAQKHPGIIKLYYTFHDEENLYFVLDLAPGGELLQLLQKRGTFTEVWSRHFMCQLIDAVEYMHSMRVIHRDLKPENVLLDREGRLMITDFGASYVVPLYGDEAHPSSEMDEITAASSFVGTAEYVSPELLLECKCYYSSDVWALGCILYQFLQGIPPFRGNNELESFEKIVHLDYKWHTQVNPLAMDLVSKILVLDPAERYTIQQIKRHKWFESVDWNDKERIWRGIGTFAPPTVPYRVNSRGIETNMKDIPVATQRRKKPAKLNTTSRIVEWRKTLGLNSQPSALKPALDITGLPVVTNKSTPPITKPRSKNDLSRPFLPQQIAPIPRSRERGPATSNITGSQNHTNSSYNIIKQDWVNICSIPYDPKAEALTKDSYRVVTDNLIMNLTQSQLNELNAASKLCLLSLDRSGKLSYIYQKVTYTIAFFTDQDLSMYDLQLEESKATGYLILEKYRKMVWIISTPERIPYSTGCINIEEPWVHCIFDVRRICEKAEEEEEELVERLGNARVTNRSPEKPQFGISGRRASIINQSQVPTPPPSAHPVAENSYSKVVSAPRIPATASVGRIQRPVAQKSGVPNNMILSSSRFEVLNSVNQRDATQNDLASSGASAAFKNIKVRRQ